MGVCWVRVFFIIWESIGLWERREVSLLKVINIGYVVVLIFIIICEVVFEDFFFYSMLR